MDHIKVIFRGCTYGPLRAPTSIRSLCAVLKVSPRASPTLQSMDRTDTIVVVDLDSPVETGLYELLVQPGISYDPAIDDLLIKMPNTASSPTTTATPSVPQAIATSTDFPVVRNQTAEDQHTQLSPPSLQHLPLETGEMDACVQAMVHLISAIPPRYVKYNRILATQIDRAMLEVDRLRNSLDQLVAKMHASTRMPAPPETVFSASTAPATPDSGTQAEYARLQTIRRPRHRPALPITIVVTFTQYRIVHILYETWKTAWKRFSPAARAFNISKIETAHAVETAEHYLNRLWMWRRILDSRVWVRLQNAAVEQDKRLGLPPLPNSVKSPPKVMPAQSASVTRLIEPPPLPSGKHPRAWEYFVQQSDRVAAFENEDHSKDMPAQRIVRLDASSTLREFRQVFVGTILRHGLYRDDELDCLLEELIVLDRAARKMTLALDSGTSSNNNNDYGELSDSAPSVLVYPADHVREAIRREFRINWTDLDEARAASAMSSRTDAAAASSAHRMQPDVAAHARVRDMLGPHRREILAQFRSAAASPPPSAVDAVLRQAARNARLPSAPIPAT